MSDGAEKFRIKKFLWQFSLCVVVYAVVMGIIIENQPWGRGRFHDLRWAAELKIRDIWADYTSTDFDPETYPGEGSPQAKDLQRKIDEWFPQALERYPRLQVEYKNVPDDQNGFLKIIEWEEESKKEELDWDGIPSGLNELLELEERDSSALLEKLREVESYLKTKDVVEVTKTVPLEKLVWLYRKEPDNEKKKIHDRREDPHPAGSGEDR